MVGLGPPIGYPSPTTPAARWSPYNKPWQIEPIAMTRTRSNGDRCPRRPRQPTMTRRQVLAQSSGFAIGVLTAGSSVLAKSGNPFTLGVAAGEPSPDGFVLWTRLARSRSPPTAWAACPTGAVAGRWPATRPCARSCARTVEAQRQSAHCVHVEVSGLEPNRPYWYRFTALGEQCPIGRARTTPARRTGSITCGLPSRPARIGSWAISAPIGTWWRSSPTSSFSSATTFTIHIHAFHRGVALCARTRVPPPPILPAIATVTPSTARIPISKRCTLPPRVW